MANLVKIWWTTKLLTRNLMDSSYILFSGTPNPSSFCIHTLLYRVIVNSAAKVQSGCDKNWHRRRKDEEGRSNYSWNTICILHEVLWKTKKNRYINKNTDAFLYVNLPHNRGMTSAQQLMDERTTADMQAHNSCCAVHDSISVSYTHLTLPTILLV